MTKSPKIETIEQKSRRQVTMKSLVTEGPRWCPACGDFGILMALKRFMVTEQMPQAQTVHVSGIGCSGRTPNYLNTYGLHGIHGRAIPIATGLVLTRPDLNVFIESGDGDALSIGGNHLLHGINKNINCIFLLFNNELYALTKSQTSPTTRKGHATNTQPQGTYLDPLNPVRLALGMGASFVANSADWMMDHLGNTLRLAAEHQGFSFVHISQRCPHYDKAAFTHKEYDWLNFLVSDDGVPPDKRVADQGNAVPHDPTDLASALRVAENFKTHLGLIYRNPKKPRYDAILREQRETAKKKSRENLLDRYEM